MANSTNSRHLREWRSLAAALALGPAFLVLGYQLRLMFSPAAAVGAFVFAVIVPLITTAGGRLKFVVWQIAIISVVAALIGDNLRVNAMHANEIPSVAYVFWAGGTLLSCPLPIYYLLRPMPARHRYIAGVCIAATGLVLCLGIKKITR